VLASLYAIQIGSTADEIAALLAIVTLKPFGFRGTKPAA
jgi:hypothetical protein